MRESVVTMRERRADIDGRGTIDGGTRSGSRLNGIQVTAESVCIKDNTGMRFLHEGSNNIVLTCSLNIAYCVII